MPRFGWRRPRRSPCPAQRKPTRFAFTLSKLEERTMLSLVSGVVADINQQVANGQTGSADLSNLTVLNGTLYFNANDGIHGPQLWKSDGTAAGTAMLTDFPQNGVPGGGPNASSVVDLGGAIFFDDATSNTVGPGSRQSTGATARRGELRRSSHPIPPPSARPGPSSPGALSIFSPRNPAIREPRLIFGKATERRSGPPSSRRFRPVSPATVSTI